MVSFVLLMFQKISSPEGSSYFGKPLFTLRLWKIDLAGCDIGISWVIFATESTQHQMRLFKKWHLADVFFFDCGRFHVSFVLLIWFVFYPELELANRTNWLVRNQSFICVIAINLKLAVVIQFTHLNVQNVQFSS